MPKTPPLVDVEMSEIEGLVERAQDRLGPEDAALLKGLVETLLSMMALVRRGRTTMARLRRLLGMTSNEKTENVRAGLPDTTQGPKGTPEEPPPSTESDDAAAPSTEEAAEEGKTRKGHGRTPAAAYPDACQLSVLHESLRPGQRCPACERGNVYELTEPARLLRIVGQPPLAAVCWSCQRLRCSGCGMVFTAEPPDEAKGEKHDETAAAMIALLHYGVGNPFHRLENLQGNLSTLLASSTQWDVVKGRSEGLRPVYDELCRVAAQDSVIHNDDTYMRILAFMASAGRSCSARVGSRAPTARAVHHRDRHRRG